MPVLINAKKGHGVLAVGVFWLNCKVPQEFFAATIFCNSVPASNWIICKMNNLTILFIMTIKRPKRQEIGPSPAIALITSLPHSRYQTSDMDTRKGRRCNTTKYDRRIFSLSH